MLILLAAVIMGLTFVGAISAAQRSVPGALFASVKSLVGGNAWDDFGWQGNLAASLDLVLVFWVAMKAALLTFAGRVDSLLCRNRRGHTIVCGLGDRGRTLAEALLQAGDTVTVVDLDEKSPDGPLLRARGARVVAGDATQPESLRRVRADKARRVIALLPSNDQNAAVARAVREICDGRQPSCYIHNTDTATWSSLFGSTAGRVVPFSVADTSSVEFFLEYDLSLAAEGTTIDLYGTGPEAEAILLRAVKVWQAETLRRGAVSPLPVCLIGCGAEALASILPLRYPGIDALCRLTTLERASVTGTERIQDGAEMASSTVTIVATGDGDETARCALMLVKSLPKESRIVAVLLSPPSLLKLLLESDPALSERLAVVDLSSALRKPAALFGGPREELARLAHEDWLRAELACGGTLTAGGPVQHWEDLTEQFRSSNRRQTEWLFGRMLPALNADIVPLAEWDAAPLTLAPQEVEQLARLEHQRWCDERQEAGWVLDRALEQRDPERKTTPWLVPYDELPELQKDSDRNVVTRFPVLLARAGFRVKRMAGSPAPAVAT